jgi:drug/metabolite transporter (DMT)-like permease
MGRPTRLLGQAPSDRGGRKTGMGRTRTIAMAEGLAAVAVWGASFIATKIALRELAPVNVVWLRFAMGVLVLAATAAWRGELALIGRRELIVFSLLGLQGITFHQWLQSTALVTSQAATSGWIVASAPVFIALLGAAVLREKVGGLPALGIAVAFAGVVVVATRGDVAGLLQGRFGAPGDVLIVVSAANWAVFSVLSRGLLRGQPPARMMLWVMLAGWLGSTALLPFGPGPGEILALSVAGWGAMVFLGVLCSGLAYVFWYDALHHARAAQVGALLYFEPLVAQAVAWLVLGERLALTTMGGGATILLGVWLVNRTRGAVPVGAEPRREAPRGRRSSNGRRDRGD